ncbi:unnamed protein product [Darwinula stevensoni]|uniref:C3H1-type domain-containing protein n=1 Tax=Darwinula stevensoni TaxID=69355 RepID=A0A7R8WY81_9CRUS|nr:unnamed protein product [Darwinula stevensoni]CAG0879074.1 unnamed protein product [Darwinula stevensoni]
MTDQEKRDEGTLTGVGYISDDGSEVSDTRPMENRKEGERGRTGTLIGDVTHGCSRHAAQAPAPAEQGQSVLVGEATSADADSLSFSFPPPSLSLSPLAHPHALTYVRTQSQGYLESVCGSVSDPRWESRRLTFPRDVYDRLRLLRDAVEKDSRAQVVFEEGGRTVLVCGGEGSVGAAVSLLEALASPPPPSIYHRHRPNPRGIGDPSELAFLEQRSPEELLFGSRLPAELSILNTSSSSISPSASASGLLRTGSWGSRKTRCHKLESEDSCYDTDQENLEPVSPHEDVSRTVSETLRQEFQEYVSLAPSIPILDKSQPPIDDKKDVDGDGEEVEEEVETLQYNSRVEFALKLGYSEGQVQRALQKLGPDPEQNELLAELIKLGAGAGVEVPGSPGDSEAGLSTTTSNIPTGETKPDACNSSSSLSSSASSSSFSLRHIVIDGSNVAMSHGNKEVFSCRGIRLAVDWFKARGHTDITVFVPKWRKESSRPDAPIQDQEILLELEKERQLVFTPSRLAGGRRLVCYDDRYILKLAAETDGIVVSNDNYRDLAAENPDFKKVVIERLLMYSFVNDRFMPPDDPLGRNGPTLDAFLRKPVGSSAPFEQLGLAPPCPYGKKCTYGNKCKFLHPERGNQPQKSVTEKLAERAQKKIQEVKARTAKSRDSSPGESLKAKLSLPDYPSGGKPKQALARTASTNPTWTLSLPQCDTEPTITLTTTSPMSPTKTCVHKSKSVENILYPLTLPPNIWNEPPPPIQQAGLLSPPYPPPTISPPSTSLFDARGTTQAKDGHRKLQRQLTLNPNYDPRLYQLRSFVPPPQKPYQMLSPMDPYMGQHLPVTRHASAQEANQSIWAAHDLAQHPNVSRIASAPDSSHRWGSTPQVKLGSTSDTQLNMGGPWGQPSFPPTQPTVSQPHLTQGPIGSRPVLTHPQISSEESRFKLYYHLAHVFPEEQVRAAMKMHPEETNAEKICATILQMFNPQ